MFLSIQIKISSEINRRNQGNIASIFLCPILTWINFNPSMDK